MREKKAKERISSRDAELNYGVSCLGDPKSVLSSSERTYIVLGVSRGGTSAAAGVLYHLGVDMGPTGEAPLFEDLRLNRCLSQGAEQTDRIIADYNAAKPVWGFKGNSIVEPYEDIAERLRNPVFVVIFRDLLAIANRAHISAGRDLANILDRQSRAYQRIVDFVVRQERYSVLLSYEKLCAHPEKVIGLMAPLCGLAPTSGQHAVAAAYIQSAPEDYLKVSRAKNKAGDT